MALLGPGMPSSRRSRSLARVYQDGEMCQPGALEPRFISSGRPEQPKGLPACINAGVIARRRDPLVNASSAAGSIGQGGGAAYGQVPEGRCRPDRPASAAGEYHSWCE